LQFFPPLLQKQIRKTKTTIVPVDAIRHKNMVFLLVILDMVREVGLCREHGECASSLTQHDHDQANLVQKTPGLPLREKVVFNQELANAADSSHRVFRAMVQQESYQRNHIKKR
jgi:hypothetical protein